MTTETSLTIVAICQLVAMIAVAAAVGGLLYVLCAFKRMISKKIDQAMAEVKPVAEQARSIAEQAKRTADTVSDRVDSIMTTAEDAATSAGNTVHDVSRRIDEAVSPQIAQIAGLVSAIAKCVQSWHDVSACRRSKPAEEPSPAEE
jgi:type I site-specific restriction endonuclease